MSTECVTFATVTTVNSALLVFTSAMSALAKQPQTFIQNPAVVEVVALVIDWMCALATAKFAPRLIAVHAAQGLGDTILARKPHG